MNVNFEQEFVSAKEGDGVLELKLVKSEGALGPVTVTLSTLQFTAQLAAEGTSISYHKNHYTLLSL